MTDSQRKRGRLQFFLIAALFFGPLLVASWLYYGGEALQPAMSATGLRVRDGRVILHDGPTVIHPNDPQRIRRALELYDSSGKTLTQFWREQEQYQQQNPPHARRGPMLPV